MQKIKKQERVYHPNKMIIIFFAIILSIQLGAQDEIIDTPKVETKSIKRTTYKSSKEVGRFYSKKTYSGNSGVGFSINYSDLQGAALQMDYVKYIQGGYLKGIVLGEYSPYLDMVHSSIGAGAQYYIDPLRAKAPDFYYLGLGGGIYASYDMLDMNKVLGDKFIRNGASLGLLFGVENQLFFSKKSSIVVNAQINYNLVTEFAKWKWWGGLGYRYNF